MAIKVVIAINMLLCGIGGMVWSKSGFLNVILKVILLSVAVMNLIALLHLEGYIIKIGG